MRCIISGSRTFHGCSVGIIQRAVDASGFGDEITEVVSGGARGIDLLGEIWAKGKGIPVSRFTPNWDEEGKPAGILRNIEMAKYCAPSGACIAISDGQSNGTAHMIKEAKKAGLRVFVGHPKKEEVEA